MQIKKSLIERIILRHPGRGMDLLAQNMPEDFCESAMRALLQLPRGTVFLTTGFYVAGYAETDGPVGTYFLARQLKALGFHPIIVTDHFCAQFFFEIPVLVVPIDADEALFRDLIAEHHPICCISIERCGINTDQDYANMRGVSIRENTAAIDLMFPIAHALGIPTFGVGDGGNEIGMGNVRRIISEKLSLTPCRTKVDHLIIATVSNWGAYGMMAYLDELAGIRCLPDFETVHRYLSRIVSIGCVDGVTKEKSATVDGFPQEIEKEILDALGEVVSQPA